MHLTTPSLRIQVTGEYTVKTVKVQGKDPERCSIPNFKSSHQHKWCCIDWVVCFPVLSDTHPLHHHHCKNKSEVSFPRKHQLSQNDSHRV